MLQFVDAEYPYRVATLCGRDPGQPLELITYGSTGLVYFSSDGVDNGGDGAADYPADPGCTDVNDPSERSPSLVCDDGVDNDSDGAAGLPGRPGL